MTGPHGDGNPGYVRPNCAREPNIDPQTTLNQDNDLVTCNAGSQVVCVTHCPSGCVEMPTGFSDECDPCATKNDGDYCGSDVGWTADGANVAITCSGHVLTAKNTCAGKVCNKANCTAGGDPSTCCP